MRLYFSSFHNLYWRSLFLCCILIFTTVSFPQAGLLDPTFGNGGIVTTALNVFGHSALNATAMQSDGKIVAVGVQYNFETNNHDFAVVRFNQNGSLDNTFGVNGIVATDFLGFEDEANAVAIQNDGKIIAVGFARQDFPYFALVRYNADGSPSKSPRRGDFKKALPFGEGLGGALKIYSYPDCKEACLIN